jgi:hypothetical protein
MAAAQQVLAESPVEGASLSLIYDDVTLIATGVVATTALGSKAMKVHIIAKDNSVYDFTIQPNQQNQVLNFPANQRIQGVRTTSWRGTPTIDWGFQALSISF